MAEVTADRDLVECSACDGAGTITTLGGTPDDYEGDAPTMDDLEATDVECDRCGGRGTEYAGLGCPRCGAPPERLSSTLLPSSSYKQNCPECPWWELVG